VQADGATDEVYARVSLLPEDEEAERRARARVREDEDADRDGEDGAAMKPLARTPHMFCKTLTASDTSTHGGFSVPRRAAEDCFPPLVRPVALKEVRSHGGLEVAWVTDSVWCGVQDYSQQRPSQELVGKDLHGTEWKFRHIYRGSTPIELYIDWVSLAWDSLWAIRFCTLCFIVRILSANMGSILLAHYSGLSTE
jgi:auxin response factor